MTISSLFGGAQPTQSILDRFDPSSSYQFQGQAFTPYVDRGGHEAEWPKSKSDSKGKTAMSALTLLAFLFFLNMLMSCLKDTIASNEPEVVIMQQRAARRARALEEHFRQKGDLGEDVHLENIEEIDMDDYDAAGDYESELESGSIKESVTENADKDRSEEIGDADGVDVVGNSIDTEEFENGDVNPVTVENFKSNALSTNGFSKELAYETSLEKPEMSKGTKVVKEENEKMLADGGNEVGYMLERETSDVIAVDKRPVHLKGWRQVMASMARPFIRRTYDVTTCKDLLACETTRIAGVLGKSSVAEGFEDMLDWLFEQSDVPQSWIDAATEGRSKKTCQVYIDKCTAETRGVSMLPVVAYLIEQFV